MMRVFLAALLILSSFAVAGCGSGDGDMKAGDSIAGDLKNAGPATGEVGGKEATKKAGN